MEKQRNHRSIFQLYGKYLKNLSIIFSINIFKALNKNQALIYSGLILGGLLLLPNHNNTPREKTTSIELYLPARTIDVQSEFICGSNDLKWASFDTSGINMLYLGGNQIDLGHFAYIDSNSGNNIPVNHSFDYEEVETRLLYRFVQGYFNVDIDPPNAPEDLFKDHLEIPWVINSIDASENINGLQPQNRLSIFLQTKVASDDEMASSFGLSAGSKWGKTQNAYSSDELANRWVYLTDEVYLGESDEANNSQSLELYIAHDPRQPEHTAFPFMVSIDSPRELVYWLGALIFLIALFSLALYLLLRRFLLYYAKRYKFQGFSISTLGQIEKDIKDGNLELALDMILVEIQEKNRELRNEIILYHSQLAFLQKAVAQGQIDFDFFYIRRNRITLRALELASAIDSC